MIYMPPCFTVYPARELFWQSYDKLPAAHQPRKTVAFSSIQKMLPMCFGFFSLFFYIWTLVALLVNSLASQKHLLMSPAVTLRLKWTFSDHSGAVNYGKFTISDIYQSIQMLVFHFRPCLSDVGYHFKKF